MVETSCLCLFMLVVYWSSWCMALFYCKIKSTNTATSSEVKTGSKLAIPKLIKMCNSSSPDLLLAQYSNNLSICRCCILAEGGCLASVLFSGSWTASLTVSSYDSSESESSLLFRLAIVKIRISTWKLFQLEKSWLIFATSQLYINLTNLWITSYIHTQLSLCNTFQVCWCVVFHIF